MIVLTLPWAPTNNSYWRRIAAGRTILSKKAREFRQDVQEYVSQHNFGCAKGRLRVSIEAFPPDKRKRDLDNLPKGILDALVHAGVIEDDGDIDHLEVIRRLGTKGGMIRVFINEIVEREE